MKENFPYRSTVLPDTPQTTVSREKSLSRWSWICALLAWLFYLLRAYNPAHNIAVTVPTLVMWLAVGMGVVVGSAGDGVTSPYALFLGHVRQHRFDVLFLDGLKGLQAACLSPCFVFT